MSNFSEFSYDNLDKEIKQLQRMQVQNNFASFVENTVHDYKGAYYLNDLFFRLQKFYTDVIAKKSPRLIINMPPRHLKSETATIRLPLFAMLNNPYFEIMLSKEEIAKYAEGSLDENNHRYCFPKNCYQQLDENNNDISLDKTVNPELWKFRDKFFSNDVNKDGTPVVSKLCVALFRLRKICAFIRKAHEYEIVDEEGKTSGNTAKIQELRESIIPSDDQSQFVLVQAADMQRSISEFVV